ncbi:hypothetical protein M433DRAFT_110997 [Acidomyces richmondensis BFW]|nr:MAG: hypothetical protein FE78DRAFT_152505 [Acidomyces sp. 'richmondensis']KYG44032.1 hypothetical protein M433DRAFT_110997 [Acidomyces richmondensis BFW]
MLQHGVPRVSGIARDKTAAAKEKERRQIEQYQALETEVRQRILVKDFTNDTFQAISRLLTQNPEYYTIWNYRRLLLQDVFARELASEKRLSNKESDPAQQEIFLLIKEDLGFLLPLLKQYPKCYWIWNHRSWLLATATTHLPADSSLDLWKGELGLVSKMLNLDSRNFHGWGYRRTVVEEIERLGGKSMVEEEFGYTTKMIKTNLSNFSAWHYRGRLIPHLLLERNSSSLARKEFLDGEFDLITNALWTDPNDQSLWFYHAYLMSTLDCSNPHSSSILDPCTNAERLHYLEQEIDNVKAMLVDGEENSKYIYQALLDYSRRYLEIESGNKKVTTKELVEWLMELKQIDPLRKGRWLDLERKMGL